MTSTKYTILATLVLLHLFAPISTSALPPAKLRAQKLRQLQRRLVQVLDEMKRGESQRAVDDEVEEEEAEEVVEAKEEGKDVVAEEVDTSAKIRRLVELSKREPFWNSFLGQLSSGLTSGVQSLIAERGKGNHGRPRPTAAPVIPAIAGVAGSGINSFVNGLLGGGGGGGGAPGGGAAGGMVFPSQPQTPAMPTGVVTIRPPPPGGNGAGDSGAAPMTRPSMIDPISGVNVTCPILHTFRLENCGKSQDTCKLDGTAPCKRGSICCPTMNCNLQCVFPENPSPRRGRCPIASRPAIEHALFSGVIEPQSCFFDDHCPADFKCCGSLPLGAGITPRYYKGVRQVGASGGVEEAFLETKLCFPAEYKKSFG